MHRESSTLLNKWKWSQAQLSYFGCKSKLGLKYWYSSAVRSMFYKLQSQHSSSHISFSYIISIYKRYYSMYHDAGMDMEMQALSVRLYCKCKWRSIADKS